MIIFNMIAALQFGLAILAGYSIYGVSLLLTHNERVQNSLGFLTGFLVIVGGDLWYRWAHHQDRGSWRYIHPGTGGMFLFVPMWIFCGVVPALGVLVLVIEKQVK